MIITRCGPGCTSCEKTQHIVEATVADQEDNAAIEKVKDLQ